MSVFTLADFFGDLSAGCFHFIKVESFDEETTIDLDINDDRVALSSSSSSEIEIVDTSFAVRPCDFSPVEVSEVGFEPDTD